jgi:hypothetical protein
MKRISTNAKAAAGATFLLLIACWLSLGVFSDREFGDLYLFVKHRPSPQFYFYAPGGGADIAMSSLTPAQRRAELAYEEFVERNGGYKRALYHYVRPAAFVIFMLFVLFGGAYLLSHAPSRRSLHRRYLL